MRGLSLLQEAVIIFVSYEACLLVREGARGRFSHGMYIRFQIRGGLSGQHVQDNCVGNQLSVGGVFFQGRSESGFSFGETA